MWLGTTKHAEAGLMEGFVIAHLESSFTTRSRYENGKFSYLENGPLWT